MCNKLVNNIVFFFQVLNWLWHVPLLCSWHWTWLEGRHRAIQVHWALLGISRQAKATMANFSCTSSTWLFILYQLCRGRIIWGTNGEGEPSETLAEIQGGHCCVWPCTQLWKDMPHIPGILITLCCDKDIPFPYPFVAFYTNMGVTMNYIFLYASISEIIEMWFWTAFKLPANVMDIFSDFALQTNHWPLEYRDIWLLLFLSPRMIILSFSQATSIISKWKQKQQQ